MENLAKATREIMWNIDPHKGGHSIFVWLMYITFLVAFAIFVYGVMQRVKFWKKGKTADDRTSDIPKRLWMVIREFLFQRQVLRNPFPGLFHSFIFYSFAVFVVTTFVVAMDYDAKTSLFNGWIYVLLSVASELGGAFVIVGVAMALWRRLSGTSKKTLPHAAADTWALILVLALVVTGFLVEGLRIQVKGDEWVQLSFVGNLFGLVFTGISQESGALAHKIIWSLHGLLAMSWIAIIPFTKFAHIVFLPTNVFLSKTKPRGELTRIDLMALMESEDFDESTFSVGVQTSADFTWKQRLDFDACIHCGRCDELCPSMAAGDPFSPQQLISKCGDLVHGKNIDGKATPNHDAEAKSPRDVVGNAFDDHFIWYCRTCGACLEICPAYIQHVDTFVELRRNETLMQARIPTEASKAIRTMENLGNPFGAQADRIDFMKSLGARIVKAGEEVDVLLWIGCATVYDPQKHKTVKDLVEILNRAGIDFGVLGGDEKCCGDPARVLGEENLFQATAKEQVELLNGRKFNTMVTICPHGYNVFKNEYPQFGGNYNVMHHSEFLAKLLAEGKIQPQNKAEGKFVFHDPCYLGRWMGKFDEPRAVLDSVPSLERAEMARHHEKSFCCGAGGGHFWMDLKGPDRINNIRVRQAQDQGADTIVTGCAFCMQMLVDSVKDLNLDETMKVRDLSSVLLDSLPAAKKED